MILLVFPQATTNGISPYRTSVLSNTHECPEWSRTILVLVGLMQYSAKLSAISDAGGEDTAYIDSGGVLAAGTDSSATYSTSDYRQAVLMLKKSGSREAKCCLLHWGCRPRMVTRIHENGGRMSEMMEMRRITKMCGS